MNCCAECFHDNQIRTIINDLNVDGDCDFCGKKDVRIYPADSNTVIAELLGSIFNLYSLCEVVNGGKFLKNALYEDWDIFSGNPNEIQELMKILCSSYFAQDEAFLSETVWIPQASDKDYLEEFGIARGHSWNHFSEIIKYHNRFHNSEFNPDAFASFLSYVVKEYPKDTIMYRARICSDKNGFSKDKMSVPPKEKRSAGRINPEGMSVLYLASESETALNEIRANAFDYVTIGEFKVNRAIRVVNLSGMAAISPFIYGSDNDIVQYAVNRKVFQDISVEIAKPLRRSDNPLEYLPTQYIADFIKNQNYDGVEYASTIRADGYNLAIFNESLFECIKISVVEVTELRYKIELIE
jgi:hypothetical protein